MSVEQRVKLRICEILRVAPQRVQDVTLLTDLVSESFVLVEAAIDLQEEFSVRLGHEDLNNMRTVGELAAIIAARVEK